MAVAKDPFRVELALTQVAAGVGDSSTSTFNTPFGRHVRTPPGRYARAACAASDPPDRPHDRLDPCRLGVERRYQQEVFPADPAPLFLARMPISSTVSRQFGDEGGTEDRQAPAAGLRQLG
jgi:hypothetical protein